MSKPSQRRRQGNGPPGYIEKIIESYGRGAITPGSVGTCIVRHDDWCSLLNGRGKCNCEPDVELSYSGVKP